MIPMRMSLGMLDQLQKDAVRSRGMNERNACVMSAASWRFVDQADTGGFQLRQRCFNVVHPNRNVMQPFAAFCDKLSNRRIRTDRFQQLEPALSDIEHGNFNALI